MREKIIRMTDKETRAELIKSIFKNILIKEIPGMEKNNEKEEIRKSKESGSKMQEKGFVVFNKRENRIMERDVNIVIIFA